MVVEKPPRINKTRMLIVALVAVVVVGIAGDLFFLRDIFWVPTRPPENMLIWETIGNPDSMDPHVSYDSFSHWVIYNIYETLYTYSWNSSATDPLLPLLAAGQPVVSADGLNYTISLRQGVKFHDGTPFNASCVKWNIERALKISYEDGPARLFAETLAGANAVWAAAQDSGTSSSAFASAFDSWVLNSGAIEVIDEHTIQFVLEKPYSPFPKILAHRVSSIMSPSFQIEHASDLEWRNWAAYGIDYGQHENFMSNHTCGTGPYMLTDWVFDNYIELDLSEDYWRVSTVIGAGTIEKVLIRTNEDIVDRSYKLRSGEIDGCYWPTTYAPDIWDYDLGVSRLEDVRVSTAGLSYGLMYIGLNMGNITTTADSATIIVESPFRNKNFRRAAAFACYYQQIIDKDIQGFGVQGEGPIPQGLLGHNGSSFDYIYNITAAVAEWNAAMQDPIFVSTLNAMGNVLTFYYPEGITFLEDTFSTLQQGLETMYSHSSADHSGLSKEMEFNMQGIDYALYSQYRESATLPVVALGWSPDIADPMEFLLSSCYHSGAYAPRIHYNNTDINNWCEAALSETNVSQRQTYLDNIQEVAAEESPYIWVYQVTEFRTWRSWLRGYGLAYNPMHGIYFYYLYKVYPFE
ncbi:MAG: ABC transporter substrate-binding protein [Promethearchaeota archaeon]